ncbi:FHA domain-containing protein [Glaciihabitans arcticus]|uniref:FHA domain-containing protein n=1 Tax=Glaciihabitans arcticus TaxID=2668039 RepID=A0A4Q9GWD5_9MICO|nr:FHA domain-containing protein [Glaciihabitans arcticus]TBN56530.1 FHA domain-containing protein [Glaciihabitans arcticus]
MVDSENLGQADENRPGENDTTLTFGDEFGAQLAALEGGVSVEEQDAIAALPSGSALLIVRRGPTSGARFLLDADVTTVGRHPDADIFLDDVTVSRRHAEFLRSGRSFQVKDLGSLNGTYLNGERIDTAPLSDRAEVQVGKFRLTFYASRVDLVAPAGS